MAYNTLGGNNSPKIVKTKYATFANFLVILRNIVVEIIMIIVIVMINIAIIFIVVIIILNRSLFLVLVFEGLIYNSKVTK